MRIPDDVLAGQAWRIHEVLGDFPLEDVWQLPHLTGSRDEFGDVVAMISRQDPAEDAPAAARLLWIVRDLLGRWFGLGGIAAAADDPPADSLRHRVPADLRGTADDVRFAALPFVPLYRTDTEFAAEIANRTMHGVMHLSWVERDADTFFPQMAVFVRPNGAFGRAYMTFIRPFRYLIVYPALERHAQQQWARRAHA